MGLFAGTTVLKWEQNPQLAELYEPIIRRYLE